MNAFLFILMNCNALEGMEGYLTLIQNAHHMVKKGDDRGNSYYTVLFNSLYCFIKQLLNSY